MSHSILITGVHGGIGRAMAFRLARAGHAMTGTARHPEAVALPFPVLPLDLTSDQSIANLAAQLQQPVDVLINNAGVATADPESGRSEAPFERLSRSEFQHILDVNVVGTFLLTRTLVPHLIRGRARIIINISSNLGSISRNHTGQRYAYRCSKAAVNMLTRSLSVDLAPSGFTCLAWHPGWVKTPMGGDEADITADQAAEAFGDFLPTVTRQHNGRFFDYRQQEVEW